MNPESVPEALSQLQGLLSAQNPDVLLNLASAIAMQSLLTNPGNPLLTAAKMMLNAASSGAPGAVEHPMASGLQSALLLQQYAALARGGDFQASLKRTLEQELGPPSKKRALDDVELEDVPESPKQVFDDTGRVPMSKEDFDDCLEKVLREEFIDEVASPKDSPVASESSISSSEIKEVVSSPSSEVSGGSLSLRDILEFNWGENGASAFRKVSRMTSSSSSPDSLMAPHEDWTTISPPGGSGRSSTSSASNSSSDSDSMCDPPPAPMPPELVERIRAVARQMMARGAPPAIPLGVEDQLEKMPSIWRGKLVIKNLTEVAVQMHIMCGEKDYMADALGPLTAAEKSKEGQPALRILQRMRAEGHALYSLLHRLQDHGSTCLCVPIGTSKEEMREHSLLLKEAFSDYFLKKGCAGVVNVDATETTPPSLIYVFPPNEFTDVYMQECAPLLLEKLKMKESEDFCYLFVAIAPQGTPAAD